MALVFFLLWIIMNGRVTLEIVLFGIVIAALIYLFAWKFLGYSPAFDLSVARNLPMILTYIAVLIREIFLAAVSVMKIVWSRDRKPDPVIIEFHSGLKGDFLNVLLANSITLTPGTYTIFQEGDRFIVHCLSQYYADGFGDLVFVKILRKFK